MPALTLDTKSASPSTAASTPIPQDASAATPQAPPTPQPTANTPPRQSTSRSLSPTRPPVSPITPPLNPATLPPVPQTSTTQLPPPAQPPSQPQPQPQQPAQPQPPNFAANRPAFTHAPIPDASATAILPPPPEPIDFDANPDVLALKSAISILQLQRQRAANDIRGLSIAKSAALEAPDAFVADLTSGRIRGQNDPLFPSADQDSSSEESDDDEEIQPDATTDKPEPPSVSQSTALDATQTPKPKGKSKSKPLKQPWADLPRPQNVVRCPPINWNQYAVAGDSLDRLHAEQVSRPSQGQPAVVGAGGTFEFRAGGGENAREFVGVAAPYTPGRDKLDKKTKGKK